MEKYLKHFERTNEKDDISEDVIDNVVLNYPEDVLKLVGNYKKFGILYHGTSAEALSREVLPPDATQIISEKGRKKNLNRVFFTRDYKSSVIYAKRAVSSYGGKPRVLKVVPIGEVITMNENQGTTVLHAPKAIVLNKKLETFLENLVSEQEAA